VNVKETIFQDASNIIICNFSTNQNRVH